MAAFLSSRSLIAAGIAGLSLSAGLAEAGPRDCVVARPRAVVVNAGCQLRPAAVVVHQPAPVYVQPAPVVAQPAPVYHQPAPVVVQPAPVYVQPAPVYVQPAPVYVQPAPVYQSGFSISFSSGSFGHGYRGHSYGHGFGHGFGHGYGHGYGYSGWGYRGGGCR